jgi:aspartate-semialdehyde dehydrogenase
MGIKIALVGATGAVGAQFLDILGAGRLQVDELRLLASKRSVGKTIDFKGQSLTVTEATPNSFDGIDVAFVTAGGHISLELCPAAVKAGAVVVDDSSIFRLEPGVPLVVPEVNADDLEGHQGIVSTPNCCAVPVVMALHALRQASPIRSVVVSTYQSVSGAGAAAVRELTEQTGRILAGEAVEPEVFPHQIAFNALPQVDKFRDDGYTVEEWKMQEETRKILAMPGLPFSVTCVRVPVFQAHSFAVNVEFEAAISPMAARGLLSEMPGMRLVDDSNRRYPHPVEAAGKDEVFVGRVREDTARPNGLALWITADNLRKGAALNCVQIIEEVLRRDLLPRR